MSDLEKEIRVLQKKLDRSERHRAAMEDMRDRDQLLYKKLHADISEARRLLEQSNLELKKTQAQLVQQEKLASLGQLTAGIAHEIKNPLNFVNNFAELNEELTQELIEALAAGADVDHIVDDLKENARRIKKHGKRAEVIVRSMMQHASGSSGAREATDVNALVGEHLALSYRSKQSQIPGLKIKIIQDLKKDVGRVELVPSDIGRVLMNLLNNAIDAVHEHAGKAPDAYTPTVHVSTRRLVDAIEIRISDNGGGIPADIRDKIFEPFFTTKPTGTGTGLGLSLSHDIVAQGHHGTLTLDNETSEGASFVISLPA